ncbi:MAG TPA: DUF5689 domain-containing protein [Chitinophagales bacterium]|nr:DUF5689 domain-containing protein [Chitinophagales bacterium]
MNTTMIKRFLIAFVAITAITLSSCKKEKYDEPSGNTPDPNLTTITIDSLRKYFTSGLPITITNDVTISGIVTADDKDGNFYKQIVIDDGTAGIPVLIERSYLYTDFPQGRKIYVKCKGLVLGAYHNYLQLGGFVDNSTGQPAVGNIPSDLADKVIVKGPTGNAVTPIVVTYSQLNNSYQARLIKIQNTEFEEAAVGLPYADIINQQSISRNLNVCDTLPGTDPKIEVRTSNYALFANELVPAGHGDFIGVYSVYNTSKQLTIRNLSDFDFSGGTRCNPITVYSPADISTLRNIYTGSNVAVGSDLLITGVVISSIADSNNLAQNLTIQDNTGGIVVRMASSSPNFNKGDQVQVKIGNADILQRFSNGSLQIGTIQNAKITKIASNVNVTPQTVTIATLISNFNDYESELIKVTGVTISGGSGLYSGTLTFTDATGSIASFVRTATMVPSAEFVNQSYLTSTVNIVGYANLNGSTKQLILRNASDVTP